MSPLAIFFLYLILVLLTLRWERRLADPLLALWDSAWSGGADHDRDRGGVHSGLIVR